MITEDFTLRSKLQDIGRWYVTDFVRTVSRNLPPDSSILDAGAGECVYRGLFSHCRYKAIDLGVGESRWNYGNLDYVAPLHEMPIEDGSFDAVLCTQVLEHLEWPRESIREIHRVLKPGGRLYLTAPMAHPEHQSPFDYFRFTSFGLESICRHAGFRDISISPFGGIWVRWAYELPRGMSLFPPTGLRGGDPHIVGVALLPFRLAAHGIIRMLQALFLRLDRFDTNRDDPFGWSCVATK